MIEHRGIGGGKLSPPVLAWFEEAAGTPAGQGALTDAQLLTGVAGRRPCLWVVMRHRFWGGFPWMGGGVAPSQTIRRMRYRLPRAADLS